MTNQQLVDKLNSIDTYVLLARCTAGLAVSQEKIDSQFYSEMYGELNEARKRIRALQEELQAQAV